MTAENDAPEITGVGDPLDETIDTANEEGTAQHIQVYTSGRGFNTGQVIELTFTNSTDSSEVYTVTYTVGDNRSDSQVARALASAVDTDPDVGDLFTLANDLATSSYMNVLEVADPNRAPFTLSTRVSDADGNELSTQALTRNAGRVNGVDYNGEGEGATAQVETLTLPASLDEGQTVRVNVEGLEISHTVASGESIEDVRDALIDLINDQADMADIVSAQSSDSNAIQLTATHPGIAFSAYGISTSASDDFTFSIDEKLSEQHCTGRCRSQ